MTTVRIRHEDDANSAYLADVPFDALDTVIPTLNDWGIADPYSVEFSAQFVYSIDRGAYFEVVIHDCEVSA